MHEMGIADGILRASIEGAEQANATRINSVDVTIGVLTEIMEDALQFAWDVLSRETMAEGAVLNVTMIEACSRCADCDAEFGHGRFDTTCPTCGSYMVELVTGRELVIDSIDID